MRRSLLWDDYAFSLTGGVGPRLHWGHCGRPAASSSGTCLGKRFCGGWLQLATVGPAGSIGLENSANHRNGVWPLNVYRSNRRWPTAFSDQAMISMVGSALKKSLLLWSKWERRCYSSVNINCICTLRVWFPFATMLWSCLPTRTGLEGLLVCSTALCGCSPG